MRHSVFCLFFLITQIGCTFPSVYSQEGQILIRGYVFSDDGESLPHVQMKNITNNTATSTNSDGHFLFQVDRGNQCIHFFHVSFSPDTLCFFVYQDTILRIKLQPRVLEEVSISAKFTNQRPLSEMSTIHLPVELVKSLPALLGEKDIIKTLTLMPGVTSGVNGTASLLVRGGSPDQNLMLVDDVPVYNLSHIFGFISIVNPDIVKDVSLYKGSFPARYGGRLSSVLDIQTRNGANEAFKGEVSVGILSSRLLVEGPLNDKKGGFLISGRASYLGLLALPFRSLATGSTSGSYANYWMTDGNIKFYHKIGKEGSQRISFNLYGGFDQWKTLESTQNQLNTLGIGWGNQIASIKYSHFFKRKWFGKATAYLSKYGYEFITKTEDRDTSAFADIDYQSYSNISKVLDVGLKYSVEGNVNSRLDLKMGFEIIRHAFNPATFESTNDNTIQSFDQNPILSFENGTFVESTWKLSPKIQLNTGLRYSVYGTDVKTYQAWEPRFSLGWSLLNNLTVKAGYSKMKQYLHLLSGGGLGLPNDVWIPVTGKIPPSSSQQIGIEIEKNWPYPALKLSIEAYWKDLDNLTTYSRGTNILSGFSIDWEKQILIGGEGKIRGIEMMLNKTHKRFSGWIAYTLSWNDRRFISALDTNWRPAKYDRRHVVNFALVGNLGKKWKTSLIFNYLSGEPISVPIAVQLGLDGNPVWIYGSDNNYRMPTHHRIDIGFDRHFFNSKNQERYLSLGIYNLYNRQNPFYLSLDQTFDVMNQVLRYRLVQQSLFPILPSVSYTWKF